MKKYKTREEPLTPEPRGETRNNSEEVKKIILESSDNDDVIEIESSTDSENSIN